MGLGEAQYFDTYGTGLEFDQTVWHDLLLKSVFEFPQKNFTDTADRPLSRGLNGSDKLVSLSATKPISLNSELNLEFDYLGQTTRLAYYTNDSYAVIGSYHVHYDGPFRDFTLSMEKFRFSWPCLEHLCRTGPVLKHQWQSACFFAEQPVDPTLALRLYPDRPYR